MLSWITFIVASLLLSPSYAHVRLTFPPARTYALDFLDNARTVGPCGFPAYADAPRTTLIAGTRLRVTWHLAYAHRGGAEIQIIRETPFQIISSLTHDQFLFQNDSTRQHADLVLPINFTCTDCVVRLLRQASEWSGAYRFWSCADVTIIPHPNATLAACAVTPAVTPVENATSIESNANSEPEPIAAAEPESYPENIPNEEPEPEPTSEIESTSINGGASTSVCFPEIPLRMNECYKGKCLNGGSCDVETGTCSCLKLFSGERCEEYDECWDNSDCSNNGKCIDTRSTTHPRLLCYCQQGWFGRNCEKRSNVVLQQNYSANPEYSTRVIRPDLYTLHWKFVDDEIEIAVEAKTLSWIGIGWRPRSLTASCRAAFPTLEARPQADAEFKEFIESQKNQPIRQKNPTVDPEQAIEDELENNIEVLCSGGKQETGNNQPNSEPEPETYNEPEPEPSTEPEPSHNYRPQGEPEPEPSSYKPRGEPEPSYETHAEPEPGAEGEPEPGAAGEPEPGAEGEPEPEPEGGAEPEAGAGNAEFHPMDCSDIVTGSVKGNLYRVQDMYTRDRSTPRPDAFYLGNDDITGAAGSQIDGITTIAFRKKVDANGKSDHSIENELMSVIWAMGQGVDRYIHRPFSGLEACSASDNGFYRHDELKYHGTSGDQRGAVVFNFHESTNVDEGLCTSEESEYKEPANCISTGDNFNCNYFASWSFDEDQDLIDITLKMRQNNRNSWIGLGISSNMRMQNTDAITAWINAQGQAVAVDRWAAGYFLPAEDASNDLRDVSGSYQNDILTINFKRPRVSNDPNDLSFTDTECQHLIYASGPLNPQGSDISQHFSTPVVSTNKICIRSCAIGTIQTATVPDDFANFIETFFPFSVTLDGVPFTDELRNTRTLSYRQLKKDLEETLSSVYRTFEIEFVHRDMKVEILNFEPENNRVNYRVKVMYDSTNGLSQSNVQDVVTNHFASFLSSNGGRIEGSPYIITIIRQSTPLANWMVAVICGVVMATIVVIFAIINIMLHKCRHQAQSSKKRSPTIKSNSSHSSSKTSEDETINKSLEKFDSEKHLSPV